MPPERTLREAHPTERAVGIDHYVSVADGIGGRLRESPEDFRVRELEAFDAAPLDADPGSYPELVIRATLRDWDTNDFARRLSDALGISRERVSWAGTKD
ncbi:MAG: tRNA pseudouridine(13) synthase TruD, partial [Halorubrum sp.]